MACCGREVYRCADLGEPAAVRSQHCRITWLGSLSTCIGDSGANGSGGYRRLMGEITEALAEGTNPSGHNLSVRDGVSN